LDNFNSSDLFRLYSGYSKAKSVQGPIDFLLGKLLYYRSSVHISSSIYNTWLNTS